MTTLPRGTGDGAWKQVLPVLVLGTIAAGCRTSTLECTLVPGEPAPPAARTAVESLLGTSRAMDAPPIRTLDSLREAAARGSEDWTVAIQPIVWGADVDGWATLAVPPQAPFYIPGQVTARFDASSDPHDAGPMLLGEVRASRRVGFLGELTRISLEPEGYPTAYGAREVDLLHGQVDVAFRPFDQDILDLTAGLRYIDLEVDVPVRTFYVFHVHERATYFDPVIGLRLQVPLGRTFSLDLRGDAGGFGIGSDLSYQVTGMLSFHLTPRVALHAGYRELGMEFEQPDFAADLSFRGPILGLRAIF